MAVETNTQIQEVRDAIVILRELNADEKVRREAYYREKRLHDEATALGHARREGIAEGEALGFEKGKISTLADLVRDGLLSLSQAAEQAHMSVSEFESKLKTS